jgi:flagellar basal body-associated protein FliL
MATKAGTPNKRSWQQPQRPVFDEHSRKVWRLLISVLALVMLAIAGIAYWMSFKPPPRSFLISITDDRKEFATVPPVPMLEQDEAALKGWAQSTKVPVLFRKLSAIASPKTFCSNLFSPTESFEFETYNAAGAAQLSKQTLRKDDTLLLYIRAHGMATLPAEGNEPQPFLVTSFEGLEELTPRNSISVGELFQQLAANRDVKTVVILDAVHFNYDPRLGQLVNEFPQAVAKALPADAANLWVVLPSGNGELSLVSPQHERTVFSLALLESWQAEKSKGALRVAWPKLLELVKDRYQQVREDEDDLAFWQSLQQLPRPDVAASSARPDPAGANVFLPTIPTPKLSKEDEKPKADDKKTDEKKVTSTNAVPFPFASSSPQTLAIFQPPAEPVPANPATPPGATANHPPAAPATPAPAAAAPPAIIPAPALPAKEDAPPRHRPFLVQYSTQLERAWRLRDELENWQQTSGLQGWSPVHFAPHQWRKLNAYLVAYEERCRAGTARDSEQLKTDLQIVIDDLERLKSHLQSGGEQTAANDQDMFDLAGAWRRFRFGANEGPSFAWQSYQASDKNALHEANRALKIYADSAYRLPDYVRLQGIMLGSPGVKLTWKSDLLRLQQQLAGMRQSFQAKSADQRIQPHMANELLASAKDVQAARDALDRKLVKFAQGLSNSPDVALPGRCQAIGLLLESPLLPAGERAALLDRVLPPLTGADAVKDIRRVSGGRAGSGSLIIDSLPEQVFAELQVIKLLSGEEREKGVTKSDGTLGGSARFCMTKLNELTAHGFDSKPDTALQLGLEFRTFLSQLPNQIRTEQQALNRLQDRRRAREQFDLFHWLLLVDGRDASQLSEVPVFLTQPFLPEPAVDGVRITMEPKQIFLSDKPQRVHVYIQLTSDKINPADLKVKLSLDHDKSLLEVVDAEARSAAIKNREVYVGGSKEWRRTFEVKGVEASNQANVILTASVVFGDKTATDDVECRLKLPNEIDLKIVPLHRWNEAEPIAGAETDNRQGAELRLYPNRNTALKFLLRNLSSEDKKVRVQLVRAPRTLRDRLFSDNRELLPEMQALERQIRSMRDGLPPQIAAGVVAETTDKRPLILPHKDSPAIAVNLEMKGAAGANPAVAAPIPTANVDVTGGLICVISNVDNPTERFVRWLDLRPYAPHELYKIGQFQFDGSQLSFQVRLNSDDLATGMQIEANPLKVVWDRSDRRLGQPTSFEAELPPGKLLAQFQGDVPAAVRSVLLPLHIDGYPRAIVYRLQLNESSITSAIDVKQDTLAGVHVGRLTHEKQMFLIQKPGSHFTLLTAPEEPPDLIVRTLLRGSDQPSATIKLDSRPAKQRLLFDLQADVTAATFARGASIEIGLEGQEPIRRLYHDRDIRVQLMSTASGGVLTFFTSVDDFRNLPLVVDTDPEDDTRASLLTAVRGNADLSAPDAIHSLPIIFDRKPPEIVRAALQTKRIVVNAKKELTPAIVIDGQVTDGNGVGVQSITVSMAAKPGAKPIGDGKPVVLDVVNNPGETFRVTQSIPEGLPEGVYDLEIQIQPRDFVGREGAPFTLPLVIEAPKPKVAKNLQLGPLFSEEAKKRSDDVKEKKKLDDEIKKLKSMQPASGS